MKYIGIEKGIFLERPNRFLARVRLGEEEVLCHVKNTGRCRELLIGGTTVYVQRAQNPERKTKYDLITARKGERLINLDSQAPNTVVKEFLPTMFPDGRVFRSEVTFGRSRFDHYVETDSRKIFLEVKGVTLEEDGVVRFPDAPTERGVKHLEELIACVRQGYDAYVFFVIQMKGVRYFEPNDATHPAFGEALRRAAREGVRVVARACEVTEDSLTIGEEVSVRL